MSADATAARPIALGHLTLLDLAPPDLVEVAAHAGYTGIGVRVATAGTAEAPWPMTGANPPMRAETRRRADALGLEIVDVEVVRLTPETRRGDHAAVLEAGAALGARVINVIGDDPDEARCAESFAALAEDARAHGLRPLLEPMAYRAVDRVETAARIAAASAGGGVLVDCLHAYRCEASARTLATLPADRVPLVQLCDAPASTPPLPAEPPLLPRGQHGSRATVATSSAITSPSRTRWPGPPSASGAPARPPTSSRRSSATRRPPPPSWTARWAPAEAWTCWSTPRASCGNTRRPSSPATTGTRRSPSTSRPRT
ncbi:sugar phosphate isomerase/epimerase [Egibacter rhizosphaerae]|uniref:Sugar phosphate isomerase/epimerase n=1 Tax=Egibacter rhizosphaerae TaxID=1670831 RepID=A0A411YI43_9ACTN|nr:sugar phosphate isomerase/epimerase [Egibacter rhizosphaerae]